MALAQFTQAMRPEIESMLKQVVYSRLDDDAAPLREMLVYHMGWEGEGAGPEAQGKRIRPLMLLLSAAAAGGDWRSALPAAAAVELVHNFSLIHDDIQDQSPLRHGRPTVWVKWGAAQAINAGDLMFTLAHLAMLQTAETTSAGVALKASRRLHETCVELTRGQYLDMSYEHERVLRMDAYWPMVSGKTAALLACCAEIGTLIGGASETHQTAMRQFGHSLGLAFQVLDDWLGIWGDEELTGKSTDSDLVTGKKTVPVLYALEQNRTFAARWKAGPVQAADVPALAALLAEEGAQTYTRALADRLTEESMRWLEESGAGENEALAALRELAGSLLRRNH